MSKAKLEGIDEFRSGNSIPVERATFTRERMAEVLEAYAAARVREALEQAAKQCEGRYQPWGNLADDRAADCMSRAAGRIRALLPSTPAQLG